MSKIEILEIKPIPLDQIVIGEGNVRKTDRNSDVDLLAESIDELGLIQPIVVQFDNVSKKYQIISGQRRFQAFCKLRDEKKLEKNEILAIVIKNLDLLSTKLISIGENIHRKALPYEDTINLISELYEKHKHHKDHIERIAKELGVSQQTVINYLRAKLVPSEVRTLVEEKKLSRNKALHLTEALYPDTKKIVEIAKRIEKTKMPSTRARRVIEISKDDPKKDADEILKESISPIKKYTIVIDISESTYEKLKNYSGKRNEEINDLVSIAIEEWIERQGSISEQSKTNQ